MNCSSIERLMARDEGALEARKAAQLQAHLEQCPRCRAAAEALGALREDLGRLRDIGLTEAEAARIRRGAIAAIAAQGRSGPRWVWAAAGFAACLVLVVGAAMVMGRLAPPGPDSVVAGPGRAPAEVETAHAVSPGPEAPAPIEDDTGAPPAEERVLQPAQCPGLREATAPIVVKMETSNPDIIIIWIGKERKISHENTEV